MNLKFVVKYRESVCIGQFVVNEIYSYICLCVFPVLCHFEKKYTTTVGTIALRKVSNAITPVASNFKKKNHLIAMIATFDSKKKKQGGPIVMEKLSMYFYEIFAIISPCIWRIVLHLAL